MILRHLEFLTALGLFGGIKQKEGKGFSTIDRAAACASGLIGALAHAAVNDRDLR